MNTVPMISHDTEVSLRGGLCNRNLDMHEYAVNMVGMKSCPYISPDGVQYHADGAMLEFAPTHPSHSASDMIADLYRQMGELERMIDANLEGRDLVDMRELDLLNPSTHPLLTESINTFGCSPDYLRGQRRSVPRAVKESPYREGGIHFHINLREEYRGNARMCAGPAQELAQATHLYLLDIQGARPADYRQWYRVPGVYRPTRYGLEYRSFGASLIEDETKLTVVAQVFWDWMVEHLNSGRVVLC